MKKAIGLVGIGLCFVSMVLVGCASMTPGQKTIVTKSTLPTLKGTWSGWTRFSSVMSSSVMTTLEIENDTVPVQGKITLENLPGPVAFLFPADFVSAGNSATVNFKNGRISSEGTLVGTSGENFYELTLYTGEKMKMTGWFYYYGMKGTSEFTKK